MSDMIGTEFAVAREPEMCAEETIFEACTVTDGDFLGRFYISRSIEVEDKLARGCRSRDYLGRRGSPQRVLSAFERSSSEKFLARTGNSRSRSSSRSMRGKQWALSRLIHRTDMVGKRLAAVQWEWSSSEHGAGRKWVHSDGSRLSAPGLIRRPGNSEACEDRGDEEGVKGG
jgi:hypothetical protein